MCFFTKDDLKKFGKWIIDSGYYKSFMTGLFGALAFVFISAVKGIWFFQSFEALLLWIEVIVLAALVFFIGAWLMYRFSIKYKTK